MLGLEANNDDCLSGHCGHQPTEHSSTVDSNNQLCIGGSVYLYFLRQYHYITLADPELAMKLIEQSAFITTSYKIIF